MVHLATATRAGSSDPRRAAIVAGCLILVLGSAWMFWPFGVPLVLAAWAAHLARPLHARLRAALHGRQGAAAAVTALLVLAVVLPIAITVLALVPAVRSLLEQLRSASGGRGVLAALVADGQAPVNANAGGMVALAREYGAGASKVAAALASASLEAALGVFVFFAVVYALLVEGDAWWTWTRMHAPADPAVLDRLRHAFHQAGRGLIVGNGLTALLQGALATVLYVSFGVPRALLLGVLSVLAALIPMTGPMLVWVPVCAGLALTGQRGKAALLAALCALIVGTVDNIVRPWLSRRFNVGMPATVVLVAMLGGVVVLGGWGLFVGPLVVRLAAEMLHICRERRVFGRG
jgi:predicted PurR-regulated permease PerM